MRGISFILIRLNLDSIHLISLLLLGLSVSSCSQTNKQTALEEDLIQVWYGKEQRFGHLGEPQRWINVLGNISPKAEVVEANYTINGKAGKTLTLGGDLHRLAEAGDFNIELSWSEVEEGENILIITAKKSIGVLISKKVRLFVEKGKKWPLPYSVDFTKVKKLQDVVQVPDGHWKLEQGGARTVQHYYDRVLTMGDTSWKNYEALVRLTLHGFTPSEPGPPTYNVSHFGVAMRWRGHHIDGRQPSRKWFPLGAQGEFLLKQNPDSCRWRLLYDGRVKEKPITYSDKRNRLELGKPMLVKAQVITMPDGQTRYRFKQWTAQAKEPKEWDIEGFESNDYPSGALCMVPHNSDVTIHEIKVKPLNK